MSLECSSDEPDQDGLIEKVAAANPHTIVVLTTGSPELLPWSSKVAGIVEAWYPGEEGGTALARMLFGDADAEGRLPVTFAAHAGDVPASTPEQWPGTSDGGAVAPIFDVVPPPGNVLPPKSIYYTEGVLAGYRWYDARHIAPAFPFGFGLSYTRWRYSQLRTTRDRVTVTVTNAGRRVGADVAQLYVRIPSPAPGVVEPPQQLKGFQKVRLRAGRSQRVTFHLDDRSFAYWDVTRHAWTAQRGCYRVYVARSSRDIVGRATVPHGVSRC